MVKHNSSCLFLAALVVLLLGTLGTTKPAVSAAPPAQTPLPTPTPLGPTALTVRAHYKTAFSLYKAKKYDNAIEEFWQVIQLDPNFALAYRWMAQAYIDKGDPDGALQRFEALLQANPNNGLAYYGLGKIYRDDKQMTAKALEYAQKAVALAPQEPWSYNLLAAVYSDMGQREQSIEMYKKALTIAPGFTPALNALNMEFNARTEEDRNHYHQLLTQNPGGPNADIYQYAIGFTYLYEDKSKAITEWNRLLENYPNSVLRGSALGMIGLVYFDLKQYDNAEKVLKQIIGEYTPSYSNIMVVGMYEALGFLYELQGKSEEAEQVYQFILNNFPYYGESVNGLGTHEQIEAKVQALHQKSTEVNKLLQMGDALSEQGDYEGALQKFLEVIKLSEKTGYTSGAFEGYSLAGDIFRLLNNDQKALGYLLKAVRLAQQIGDKDREAYSRGNLSGIYREMGDMPTALREAQLAESLAGPLTVGEAAQAVGLIYLDMGDYEKALQQLQKSVTWLETMPIGDRQNDLANAYQSIGVVYEIKNDYTKAIEYYQKTLGVSDLLPTVTLNAYDHISNLYVRMGNVQKAIEVRQQQLAWAQNIKFKLGEAETYRELALLTNDWSVKDAEKALTIYQGLQNLKGVAMAYGMISIAYKAKGNRDKVIEYMIKELDAFESLRARLTVEEFKTTYFEDVVGSYGLLVRELYSKAEGLPEDAQRPWLERAFNYWERAKARTYLDLIGNQRINIKRIGDPALAQQEQQLRAEIQALDRRFTAEISKPQDQQSLDLIQTLNAKLDEKQVEYTNLLVTLKVQNPEYVSLLTIDPLTLPQVQALLDKNTMLVEYAVFDVGILAFVISKEDFEVVPIVVPQTEVEATIQEFRDFSSLEDAQPASLVKLYNWLITPLKPYLKTHQLVIVPHGLLHYLPFQALTDGKHALIEDYIIAYAPSASVLKFALEKRKVKADTVLAFGNPKVEGLPILHHAAQEAQSVAKLYNTQPITGEVATESKFKAVAGNYSILHIAAHGEYNPSKPLFSALRLTSAGGDDGRLEVHEIYGLDLTRADLVVLSACETQLGQVTKGDEIVGLSRAFIYAGTPTIITSLWNVDDQATNFLMTSFYKHLKQGLSKAEALRTAQMETRAKYPHPYYWAAFVLTGDPGKTTESVATSQP